MAVVAAARKGRLRQRYDGEYRLVAGCVPYRVRASGGGGEVVEVLMVSTPNRADLVFPKGGWEDDEDVHEAACREAMEEAGVRGHIDRVSLGLWVFRSKSSSGGGGGEMSTSPRGACKGYMFALEVTDELERWPEQDTHGRRWVSPEDAFGLCRYDWMREALAALLARLSPPAPAPASLVLPPSAPEPAGVYGMAMLNAAADRALALC
ncbi:nudix hydrolase 12, mitochondrial-like [Oryza brachyantha]|uniref:nudix hydrolase 12, mitochondrial-like n=1 Tax=Oryza brachyantha TaxID=4533 RepID=UPI001ADA25D9|nr:nudix hydrolase 12, mitochondrial-like [Oryza brachyantha]